MKRLCASLKRRFTSCGPRSALRFLICTGAKYNSGSGYVRHCVESLLARLDADVIAPTDLPWRERLSLLLRITCDSKVQGLPTFDRGMLMLEHRVAEPKHHRRVYDELASRWESAFAACVDLESPPSPRAVRAMLTAAWGARRYRLLLEESPELTGDEWLSEIEAMVLARVSP